MTHIQNKDIEKIIQQTQAQSIFNANILAIHGEAGKTWLQQLPAHLQTLSKLWELRFIQTIPDLSCNFVALVELSLTSEIVILKTAPHGVDLTREAKWLRSFKRGVPLILKIDEEKNAFLMERLEPGVALKSLVRKGKDEAATRIICQTILELQSEPAPLAPYKLLSELSNDLRFLNGHLETSMISKAESLFRDLSADPGQDILLHGDLHHDNILASDSSWKVIDPHGYIGDPAAEVGVMIRNPFDCFPTDRPLKKVLETRLKILSEMLPFDPRRMHAWAFCLTLLSAAWDIEGHGKISNNTLEVALVIEKIKF